MGIMTYDDVEDVRSCWRTFFRTSAEVRHEATSQASTKAWLHASFLVGAVIWNAQVGVGVGMFAPRRELPFPLLSCDRLARRMRRDYVLHGIGIQGLVEASNVWVLVV